MSRFFLKAVIQAVLLFGFDTWVVTPCMGNTLEGFQAQVVRWLKVRLRRRTPDRKWTYTSAVTLREEVGLLTIEE